MAKHVWENNTHGYAVLPIIAVFCFTLAILTPPALCADIPFSETAVETPKSDETQKPGGTEKTDDAKKTDEPSQTGKTDESGEATEIKVDLSKLSIEELMNVEVTIASKKPETVMDTASAVYILTGEDIGRLGVTNIPDALRLVPGMDVAQVSGDSWAVSCRGFNNDFSNKLLVLIDGRSVYNALYSGIYWDVQDVMLEDVDRIEVIRGPGATMWGANAVNGVINIVTKSASDTQGDIVSETTGSVLQNISVVRSGAQAGKNGHYRVFGKYLKQGPFVNQTGGNANDSYNLLHGGFRADWDTPKSGLVTLQGDIYSGSISETLTLPFLTSPYSRQVPNNPPVSGGNLLTRWTRTISEKSNFTLQMYYDRMYRGREIHGEEQNTLDLQFQQEVKPDPRYDVIWGLEYRYIAESIQNTPFVSLTPPNLDQRLISAFAQGEIVLAKNLLRLTIGSKFEHNDFTGFEIQPTIRFLWTPDPRHTVWAAVSRAVRTPSFGDDYARSNISAFPNPFDPHLPSLVSTFGNTNFRSEQLLAYELGYRIRKGKRLSLDTAAFYNVYQSLRTYEPGTPFFEPLPVPHIVIPLFAANKMHGNSYGVELAANWYPRDSWQVAAGYTYLKTNLYLDPDSGDDFTLEHGYNDPPNQFFVRSSLDLSKKTHFDSILRYVDKLPSQSVPSYWALDLRLAWKPRSDLDISIVGRNLLSRRHLEFITSAFPIPITEVPRSVYGTITWKF